MTTAPCLTEGAAAQRINRHRSETYAQDRLDWYVEPPWAVDAILPVLLRDLGWRGDRWHDPCAGVGTIPAACRRHGIACTGSDVADRGVPGVEPKVDFLSPLPAFQAGQFEVIISNPPYLGSKGIIAAGDAALRIAPRVALLAPLPFLASQGRHALFTRQWPVRAVIVLSKRPSMPPGDVAVEERAAGRDPKGGKEDYVWIALDRDDNRAPWPPMTWIVPNQEAT